MDIANTYEVEMSKENWNGFDIIKVILVTMIIYIIVWGVVLWLDTL